MFTQAVVRLPVEFHLVRVILDFDSGWSMTSCSRWMEKILKLPFGILSKVVTSKISYANGEILLQSCASSLSSCSGLSNCCTALSSCSCYCTNTVEVAKIIMLCFFEQFASSLDLNLNKALVTVALISYIFKYSY